jgi:tetratricopeptide (TPR) repeat protein
LANLLPTDYRVRACITACLHERARVSTSAAFELALYYKIGFGVAQDDIRSEFHLGQSRRSSKELEDRIESIRRTELYLELDFKSPLRISNHCFNIGGIARYHNDQPLSDPAELEHRRELADMEKALGADAPPVLCLRMVLVGILIAKGNFKEARNLRLQGERKSGARPVLEQNHRPAMGIYQILEDFEHQDRWKDPEKLRKQLLNESPQGFPEGHPDILGNMVRLASIYKVHSKWKEVEALEQQMLEIARRDLGQEHPWTLLIMSCLAATYVVQDRWNEAEKLQIPLIKLSQEVLGKEHEQTLSSMTVLAVIYEGQKRWEEAEKLHEQVMQVSTRVLGQENHHTLISMANLAIGYKRQGRLKEAEKLELQVTKIRSQLQGWSNRYTLSSMKHLAATYRAQGRWTEAIKLDIKATMYQIRATCRFKRYDLQMCWWTRPWWCRWTQIRRIFQS